MSRAVHCASSIASGERVFSGENSMARIAKGVVIVMVAAGVALGGCATRESVENAQASANAADRHAGVAQGRAEEAYGLGDKAMATGVDAKNTAMTAEQKADQ